MENVIEELKQFMEHNGISQNKISSMLPFSSSTLISLMKGTFSSKDPSLKEKHLLAIRAMLDAEKERFEDEIGRAIIPFVNTYNYRIFKEVASLCEKYLEIGVITGVQGLGKTRSAKKYFYDHPSSIYICLRRSFNTSILIRKLFEAVGGSGKVVKSGSSKIYPCLDDMVSFIVDKVKGSKRLFIFDQLEYASDKGIDILRSIYDECLDENGNGTIGIVFTGLPDLIYQLKNFPQLHQRINWFRQLGLHKEGEDLPVGMTDNDVELFVHAVFPKANDKLVEVFAEQSDYNPRVLKKVLDRTMRLCELNKCTLAKEVIYEACKTTKLP